ncbi:MAG: polyphosphate--glucose phosphotransferase [bacterium]
MEILGIDIGGSGVKGAPVDCETGELTQARHRIPTPQPATPKAVTGTIKAFADEFNWTGRIGCGFPAIVQNGIVKSAANISEKWVGMNAEGIFAKATGCRTVVKNDADVAALAEMKLGAGKNQKGVVLLITVGTGLGTALFHEGRLIPNLELGHAFFKGKIAERYASDAARKREDLSWPQWSDRFNKYLKYLERLLSPDLFIIGGGVSKKFGKIQPHLSIETRIVPAELLNNAGIIGAAIAASQAVYNDNV